MNFSDLVALAQNYGGALAAPALPGASAEFREDLARAMAQVPEPLLAPAGLLAMCLAGRRRR